MARGKHEKQGGNAARTAVISAAVVAGAAAPVVFTGTAQAATQSQWDCIALWESGGQWHLPGGTLDSTGGLQIRTSTWLDFGGQVYAPQAYQATEAQQIAIAEKILHGQGPGAWTTNFHCGLTMVPFDGSAPVSAPAPVVTKPPVADLPAPPDASEPKPAEPMRHWTPRHHSHIVRSGEYLFLIAKHHYGDGNRWRDIYNANRSVIGNNPNLILPGQVLVLP